jgi:hypothetical protein
MRQSLAGNLQIWCLGQLVWSLSFRQRQAEDCTGPGHRKWTMMALLDAPMPDALEEKCRNDRAFAIAGNQKPIARSVLTNFDPVLPKRYVLRTLALRGP